MTGSLNDRILFVLTRGCLMGYANITSRYISLYILILNGLDFCNRVSISVMQRVFILAIFVDLTFPFAKESLFCYDPSPNCSVPF